MGVTFSGVILRGATVSGGGAPPPPPAFSDDFNDNPTNAQLLAGGRPGGRPTWFVNSGSYYATSGFLQPLGGAGGGQNISVPSTTAYGTFQVDVRGDAASSSQPTMYFILDTAGLNGYGFQFNPVGGNLQLFAVVGGFVTLFQNWSVPGAFVFYTLKIVRSPAGLFTVTFNGSTLSPTMTENTVTTSDRMRVQVGNNYDEHIDNISWSP